MHPSDGTLRRSLDEPIAIAAASREHVVTCARCRDRVRRMRVDASSVRAMLVAQDPVVDVAAARARLAGTEAAAIAPAPRSARTVRPGNGRASRVMAGLAVAAVAAVASVLLVVTGGAQDFLSLFQPKQLAPVPVTAADVRSLAGLTSYGTVGGGSAIAFTPEPDAAAAAAASGPAVPTVADLP